ncbi:MAG TPA: hypothetical protein VLE23_15970 [Geminicoccaceae bacterium]|nr:hypothetical protein [Geminicoccaceae bacterium]
MAMLKHLRRRLCATTALAALLAVAPVQLAPNLDDGVPALKANAAFAKNGSDDGGNSGRGGGGNSGSGSGSSGRGGGDDGGSSGRGGGDDGGSSGRSGGDDGGSSGSSGSNSGPGGGGSSGRGGGDDHARRGGGDDDGRREDDRADRGGTKVEIEGDKIEVTFADGTKQEIEDGRFEQKNAAGRTIVERPATPEDVNRLKAAAAARNSVGMSMRSQGAKVEVSGRNIEVTHADGWREEIEGGRYELKDPKNNTVVERAATGDDRSRLEGMLKF